MRSYTSITIIYNPNSTGRSKELAHECRAQLARIFPKVKTTLMPTRRVGHGEELAYKLARATPRPLIIAASGDGGYNEVVNGLMRAELEGARPTAGLLPAGNANDHYRTLHHERHEDFVESLRAGHRRRIDVLKLTGMSHGRPFVRYAHSYIGFGLTPKAGRELNKTALNRLNEVLIVLGVMLRFKPTRLIIGGRTRAYDSLVFSNVGSMSKTISLSDAAEVDDGKFEVVALRHRAKFHLFHHLLKASTIGLKSHRQHSEFTLKTTRPTLVQLDGEVARLDEGCSVSIELLPRALECIA